VLRLVDELRFDGVDAGGLDELRRRKAFLDMLGVFAEFETNLRRKRHIHWCLDDLALSPRFNRPKELLPPRPAGAAAPLFQAVVVRGRTWPVRRKLATDCAQRARVRAPDRARNWPVRRKPPKGAPLRQKVAKQALSSLSFYP
jgi:hypothetical protein